MPSTLATANYRALRLLADTAQGGVIPSLARLIAALEREPECHSIVLEKEFGATRVQGMDRLDMPSWHWAPR